MTQWKLILAYDGTSFHGWQIQPGLPTVQGLLADAIHRTTSERVLPQGSGRTDAGVHALGQVASFALAAPIPAANLHRALNRCLPPSVRVLSAEIVPPDFHARHSAIGKTYEYRIFPLRAAKDGVPHPSQSHRDGWDVNRLADSENVCPPTLAPFVWPCPWPLDLDALNQAARHVIGTHDFTSFAASDPDLTARTRECAPTKSQDNCHSERSEESPHSSPPGSSLTGIAPIRTITHSCWHIEDGLAIYRVTANGFLHHMVRNLVGTFVQAGARRLAPGSIPTILGTRNRAAAGPTAPASGLFLVSVDYPAPTGILQPATGNSP